MATEKFKTFMNSGYYEIPKYQRGFSWEIENINDLFNDINEALETNSNHFIGTIVLSKNEKDEEKYYLVDGQQRVTAITMIINSLIDYLNEDDKKFYKRQYIKNEDCYKLIPQNRDKKFYFDLLENELNGTKPESKSQRLLLLINNEIKNRVENISNKKNFLKNIENLEIVKFIEKSEGDAIRIFQTVNDRGKLLSNMEKAKSLLIYFSNRYLKGKLDQSINEKFGEIFEFFDDIKELAEKNKIKLIAGKEFNEDNIMRYHFITFSNINYDATAEYVLEYLKNKLSGYRNNNTKKLKGFILQYHISLYSFFKSFKNLIEKANENEKYYKLFSILGISSTLYPLLVKLNKYDMLDKVISTNNYSLLDIIELIDVRVYKTRGTDPRSQISAFSYDIKATTKIKEIADWLIEYNKNWMTGDQFLLQLKGDIYRNQALVFMFVNLCEKIRDKKFSIDELREISEKKPTIDHILPQTPKFSRPHYFGFNSKLDYLEYEHTLGNLTLLEERYNKHLQNKNPTEKSNIYSRSIFDITQKVSAKIKTVGNFTKKELAKRTNDLVEKISQRWWC